LTVQVLSCKNNQISLAPMRRGYGVRGNYVKEFHPALRAPLKRGTYVYTTLMNVLAIE
jgi:hypothetical protein